MPKSPTFPDLFDECKQITITGLKRLGYLKQGSIVHGYYSWTRGGNLCGRICITASLSDSYIELDYNYGDKPVCYRVQLESISRHFGGCEWYFVCPVTGKRCRTLYGIGEFYFSRSAYPSAMYSEQTKSKQSRGISNALSCLYLESDFRSKRHARTTYKGKLTNRFRRMLDRQERYDPRELRHLLSS